MGVAMNNIKELLHRLTNLDVITPEDFTRLVRAGQRQGLYPIETPLPWSKEGLQQIFAHWPVEVEVLKFTVYPYRFRMSGPRYEITVNIRMMRSDSGWYQQPATLDAYDFDQLLARVANQIDHMLRHSGFDPNTPPEVWDWYHKIDFWLAEESVYCVDEEYDGDLPSP